MKCKATWIHDGTYMGNSKTITNCKLKNNFDVNHSIEHRHLE